MLTIVCMKICIVNTAKCSRACECLPNEKHKTYEKKTLEIRSRGNVLRQPPVLPFLYINKNIYLVQKKKKLRACGFFCFYLIRV